MKVKDAQKLRDILMIVGLVIMLAASLFGKDLSQAEFQLGF